MDCVWKVRYWRPAGNGTIKLSMTWRAVIFRVRPREYEDGAVSFTLLIMSEYEVGRVVRG